MPKMAMGAGRMEQRQQDKPEQQVRAHSGPDADKVLPELEKELVRVSDDLTLLWHRPPIEEVERQDRDPDTVRVFLNGCFDLMHLGHFNALRQAKSLFYQRGFKKVVLVAGLHSDAAVAGQKGPPMLSEEERLSVLRATKWVDELATALPYVSMSARMADALRVQWICHGDDMPVCKGGGGMYSDAIENGRFQLLKRTEGISTTQILERILQTSHSGGSEPSSKAGPSSDCTSSELGTAWATTQRFASFAAPPNPWNVARSLTEAKRVVYIGGTFDLLNEGHVELLEKVSRLGDYLLVGLHSDETVRKHRGRLPVLTLLERAMAVMSLRCVDDVVLSAPWEVSRDLLTTMNVSVVAAGCARPWGTKRPAAALQEADAGSRGGGGGDPRLAAPRELRLVVDVDVESSITSEALRQRFLDSREAIARRNGALLPKELAYVERRTYVPES